jgi:phosphate transport system permease protein
MKGIAHTQKSVAGQGGATRRGAAYLCHLTVALSWLAPLVVLGALGTLCFFLCLRSVDALDWTLLFGTTPPLQALLGLSPVWDGIFPACVGTGCLVLVSMAFALPTGIGCGIYLAEYASPAQRRWIGCAAEMLAGTPSIVMGLFGFLIILFLRRTFLPQANTCLLLSALCLALLVLPVLIVATREALEANPHSLRMAAAALGFSRQQALRHILLPAASRGIVSGTVLALGRAAEDTAVIMLTGVVANAGLPAGLLAKFEALPFFIYYTAAEYQTEAELARGFGAAVLLLGVALVLLSLAALMRRRIPR